MYSFPRKLWNELEDEFELMTDYSGRAMYGDTCIGIIGAARDLILFVVRVSTWFEEDDTELVEELADNVRSDNMGTDMIFYFPGIKLEDE